MDALPPRAYSLRGMIPREAILRLLTDDDADTVKLVKNQLALGGPGGLDDLRALLAGAGPGAAHHLRAVITEIEASNTDAVFERLCAAFGENGNIEEAAWRLANAFLPGEDFLPQRGKLDEWGSEVSRRIAKAGTDLDCIETLVEFLGHDIRLAGNAQDYYNINNSLLPEVIDTRRGLPITLSLVYMLVGQRAGMTLSGVGLPGHFIVRHGENFFDPFNGGRRLGLKDCRALAAQVQTPLRPEHLQAVSSRQMLLRILQNIVALAAESDPPLAMKVDGWAEILAGAREN